MGWRSVFGMLGKHVDRLFHVRSLRRDAKMPDYSRVAMLSDLLLPSLFFRLSGRQVGVAGQLI